MSKQMKVSEQHQPRVGEIYHDTKNKERELWVEVVDPKARYDRQVQGSLYERGHESEQVQPYATNLVIFSAVWRSTGRTFKTR